MINESTWEYHHYELRDARGQQCRAALWGEKIGAEAEGKGGGVP